MCLIITGPAHHVRSTLLTTPGLTESIYDYNADGIGFMYATANDKLRTRKFLPNTIKEFDDAIRRLPTDNRTIAVHARYKTHGTINMDNVHPYPVIEGRIAMMHNGVLAHGNSADRTKSDTWHYIENHVRPLLEVYPDAYKNEGVMSIIENDIGTGNRFVFMNDKGEMEIYNAHTGIEHNGLWFSNTYAWEPWLLIPTYKKPAPKPVYGSAWPRLGNAALGIAPSVNGTELGEAHWRDELDDYYGSSGDDLHSTAELWRTDPQAAKTQAELDSTFLGDLYDSLYDNDAELLAELLEERPNFALRALFSGETFQGTADEMESADAQTLMLVPLLEQGDIVELSALCIEDDMSYELAKTMIWYGTWTAKELDTYRRGVPDTLDVDSLDDFEQYEGYNVAAAAARMTA